MGIDRINEVDIISINKETGICTLTIVDRLDWIDEHEHLLLLQEKLNTYLSFTESGEIYTSYSPSKEKDFEINICFKNAVPKIGEEFLHSASKMISSVGFKLTYSIG